ncbi:glycosyltransferase family 2 protein [Bacillus massiliglaciei]|uniref:glycosyltransferase family 2 protein n=1 Tax=Bacillus massiliglaciei TaxID=1816693 RepID=UPI000B0202C4|nr:glycosyltransferase family 2 protein [Bacillus massiliglaciei]
MEDPLQQLEKSNNIIYNSEGRYIKNNGLLFKKSKITVVTPVYNAEKFLRKTIDSVINQSIGFKNIEYILVDDGSTDSSREILFEYANQYKNIIIVFFQNNTGTPAGPRNYGIQLAKSPYITFLDADDWLEPDGLENLYKIIKQTGDDYIVGKTIEVGNKGNKIIGEHESWIERRGISPFSIPHMFQHLGPRARMMKTSLLKRYDIRFPEMKYAEDKQFFIDVLIHCHKISTTRHVVYYLNRLEENNESLTKQTDVMEKMDTNIQVIKYVKEKNLDIHKEKSILNRLYEFDCITRLFNRHHFFKSEDKTSYIDKFREVLDTTKDLSYDFTEQFFHPINKKAYELFQSERYDEMEKLFKWNKKEKVKQFEIIDSLPYFQVPFLKGTDQYIRVPLLAVYQNGRFQKGAYHLKFDVYGEDAQTVREIVLRDRSDLLNEHRFPLNINEAGTAEVILDLDVLDKLKSSSYEVFIIFSEYRKASITNPAMVQYKKRTFQFYTTINSNIGFKLN